MKKKRSKHHRTKAHFIQKWGTYQNETLVVVGMEHDEIVRLMKRHHYKTELVKSFGQEWKKALENCIKKDEAVTWWSKGWSVIWFKHWKNDWAHFDVLLHETRHATDAICGDGKAMKDESEGMAYQHEYLFREIRRKLYKLWL